LKQGYTPKYRQEKPRSTTEKRKREKKDVGVNAKKRNPRKPKTRPFRFPLVQGLEKFGWVLLLPWVDSQRFVGMGPDGRHLQKCPVGKGNSDPALHNNWHKHLCLGSTQKHQHEAGKEICCLEETRE
jgi:hypothetical protein